jgi:hypothetical protein
MLQLRQQAEAVGSHSLNPLLRPQQNLSPENRRHHFRAFTLAHFPANRGIIDNYGSKRCSLVRNNSVI